MAVKKVTKPTSKKNTQKKKADTDIESALTLLAQNAVTTNNKLDKMIDVMGELTNSIKGISQEPAEEEKVDMMKPRTLKYKMMWVYRGEITPNSNEFQMTGRRFNTLEELKEYGAKRGGRFTRGQEQVVLPSDPQ